MGEAQRAARGSVTIHPSWLRQGPASQPLRAISSTCEMQARALPAGLGLVRTWGPAPLCLKAAPATRSLSKGR